MKNKLTLLIIYFLIIGLMACTALRAENSLDMSDTFLKIKENAFFHDVGPNGVAIFDWGDKEIKIIDWNFKIVNRLPIKLGEGPGEIVQDVFSICSIGDSFLVNGLFEKKIKFFDKKGSYIKSVPLEFIPRKMVYRNNELYIFNIRFNPLILPFTLGKIIDPDSGKTRSDININYELESSKLFEGHSGLIGLSSSFDVGEDKNIYLLMSASNTIYKLGENGTLIEKTVLPYKQRILIRKEKNGDNERTIISTRDLYVDVKVLRGDVFACFHQHLQKDKKSGMDIFQTHIIRVSGSKKISEKIFKGQQIMIGEHQDNLYLFNYEDYRVLAVKRSEWD